MTSHEEAPNMSGRASIVAAVRSPLKFLALVVLVLEALMTPLVLRADGIDFSILLVGMLALIFSLVGVSIFIIIRHPDVLGDQDPKLRSELNAAEARATLAADDKSKAAERAEGLQETVQKLNASNQELQRTLDELTSLKNRLLAVLNRSDSVGDIEIFRELGVDTNPARKQEVLAALGVLINEGKAARGSLSGYYRAISGSTTAA